MSSLKYVRHIRKDAMINSSAIELPDASEKPLLRHYSTKEARTNHVTSTFFRRFAITLTARP